jgi:hypothetical protein
VSERLTRAALVIMLGALGAHAAIAAIVFVKSTEPAGDFDRYYEIASGRGRPYVDYPVEHPIGTLLTFKALASIPAGASGRASFGRSVVALNAFADSIVVASLLWAWGVPAAAYYAVVTLPISGLLFNRIDFWSMAAATLAMASWRRGRPWLAASALAAGVSLKLWPLPLAAVLLARSSDRRAAAGIFALAIGALAAAALLFGGLSPIIEVLTFRGASGWQIESSIGSLIRLVAASSIRFESGSLRTGAMTGPASIALFAAAGPICLWAGWRSMRTGRVGTGWLASVSVLLLLSALFSPQYVGWLIPGGAIAWAERDRRSALLAGLTVAITQWFYANYDHVIEGARWALALVVLRNIVVIALAVNAMRTLASASLLEPDLEPQLAPVRVVEGPERRR